MKRQFLKVLFVAIIAWGIAACGGGADEKADSPPAAAPAPGTPKLHLAMLDANQMQIRTADGSAKSDYIIVTFANMSGGKILGSLYQLHHQQPSYPLNFAYQPGYNHVEVKYANNAVIEDGTNFLPKDAAPACPTQPMYAASTQNAAAPNVIPMVGLNAVVLLTPKTGDYAQWVYVGLQNSNGTVEYRLYQKPVLPLKIPLTGYVNVTVSTGTEAADGSYASGAAKTWDFGPVASAAGMSQTIMIPGVQAPDIPITPENPTDPVIPPQPTVYPTVVTINTVSKQVTITPTIVDRKIVNLVGGAQEEILDINGNVIFGYIVDWEDAGTQYANYLQLPATSFNVAAKPLGTGSASPFLYRPDKSKVYFETTKCQVFLNGVDVTQSATATSGVIKY